MPNTKMTREKWKNHFQYGKMLYIVIALVAVLVADLVYTMTTYQAPNARRVDIMFVQSYTDTEQLDDFAVEALADGQSFDETLEELTFQSIAYDPSDSSDYYGSQKFMVMLAAQEGDIYILPESLLESMVDQEIVISLDDYIESGVISALDADLEAGTLEEAYDEDEGETATGIKHIYAYSIENWYGLMDHNIDNRGMYACIMAYSQNQDTVAHVLEYMNQAFTAEKPDWVAQAEEAAAEEEIEEPVFAEEDYDMEESEGA